MPFFSSLACVYVFRWINPCQIVPSLAISLAPSSITWSPYSLSERISASQCPPADQALSCLSVQMSACANTHHGHLPAVAASIRSAHKQRGKMTQRSAELPLPKFHSPTWVRRRVGNLAPARPLGLGEARLLLLLWRKLLVDGVGSNVLGAGEFKLDELRVSNRTRLERWVLKSGG